MALPVSALAFINKPGQRVEITDYLVDGKTTVVFFHAPWSKTSSRYKVELEEWERSQSEVALVAVDIQKLGSAVAKQYNISSVPAFLVFDDKGEQTHSGQAAMAEVLDLMKS